MSVARQAILCPLEGMDVMTIEQMDCIYDQAPDMNVIMMIGYESEKGYGQGHGDGDGYRYGDGLYERNDENMDWT